MGIKEPSSLSFGILIQPVLCPSAFVDGVWDFLYFSSIPSSRFSQDHLRGMAQTPVILSGVAKRSLHMFFWHSLSCFLFPILLSPSSTSSVLSGFFPLVYSQRNGLVFLHIHTYWICSSIILSLCARKRFHTFCLQHRGSPHGLFAWVNTIPFAWKSLLLWYKYFPIFKLVSSKK